MDAISMIVRALAFGAATRAVGGQRVTDAYLQLKQLVGDRYNRSSDVAALEADPSSEMLRKTLEEQLASTDVSTNPDVMRAATELTRALAQTPDADSEAIGIRVRELEALRASFRNISATGAAKAVSIDELTALEAEFRDVTASGPHSSDRITATGPVVAIGNAKLGELYVKVEQFFDSHPVVDRTMEARTSAARFLAMANSKRVLFASLDNEIWSHVFQSLHQLRDELSQTHAAVRIAEPVVSRVVGLMVRAIAGYLAIHEAGYIGFVQPSSSSYTAHRERDWPGLGPAAENLLQLRQLLNSGIKYLESFVDDGSVHHWDPPTLSTTEFWVDYAKQQEICSTCGADVARRPRRICEICSGHNVGFYLSIRDLKYWPKTVFVAGSFNNWRPDELAMEVFHGGGSPTWAVRISLEPGKYLYKYIVDGEWILDPRNPTAEVDEHGSKNSVLEAH